MIGRPFGRFRITGKLGQGGMATVWKAEDGLLGRPVALKLLSETLMGSPDARRRFLHEAETARLLDHPGIAAVHDAGETDGVAWLAMEYVEGETLSERITQRLMPLEEAVRIVCEAAAALSHAHARGVVHRDVTPRNIMVTRDGRTKVLDFGLALVEGQSRVTTSQTRLGTVSYLSPEVAIGHTADPRTDLYGLGVVLYEALTGALPFASDRPEAVLYGIVNQPPTPPRTYRPEIPEALERVVLRAMARRPEDRHGSADELAAELRAVLSGGEAGPQAAAGAGALHGADEPLPPPHTRGGPVYLAVLPFEDAVTSDDPQGGRRALAAGLAETVAAALGRGLDLHVIPPAPTAPPAGETPQDTARRLGANLLLRGTVRRAGAQIRLAWSLMDPQRGVQVAGDRLDGSALELFELEDRLIADLRTALGHGRFRVGEAAPARPRDPAARERYVQALGYLQRHDNEAAVDGAIGLLERLQAGEPGDARMHAALGRAYLYKHRLTSQRVWADRAAAACERALALDADDPDVRATRGDLRASVGRREEAIADYRRALELKPDLPEALLGMARATADSGDFHEAEGAARKFITRRHRDWRGYSMLGFVYYQEGSYARALEPWRRAVRLAPDNARALRNLGTAYYQLDRLEEAVTAFRRSLEVEPSGAGYTNLGTAFFAIGRYEEAAEAFLKATELAPSDAVAWSNLGRAYHYIPGRASEAVTVQERAVEMMRDRLRRNPAEAQGWERLSSMLEHLGRRSDAEEAMDRALRLSPQDPLVLASAAGLQCQSGRRERALQYVREAMQHGHGAGRMLREPNLAPLRDDPEFRRIVEEEAVSHPHSREGGTS